MSKLGAFYNFRKYNFILPGLCITIIPFSQLEWTLLKNFGVFVSLTS